jgi:soluble lytic murein transglycosylase
MQPGHGIQLFWEKSSLPLAEGEVAVKGLRMRRTFLMSCLLAVFACTQTLAQSYDHRLQQALGLVQAKKWAQAMQTIGTLEVTAAPLPALGRLWYLRGTIALQLQNTEAAQRDFSQVLRTYPPLGDYAGWELLQLYARQEELTKLYDTFRVLTKRYPFSRLLPESYLLLAQTLQRQGQYAQAQVTLEQFLRTYATHRLAPDALFLLGQIYEDTGQTALSAQTLRRLGESYPTHTLATGALERSANLFTQLPPAQRSAPTPQQLLASLDKLIGAQRWPEVESRLAMLETHTQPSSLVSAVLLKRATAALHRRQFTQASTTLLTLLHDLPPGEHVAETLYLLGRVDQQGGNLADSEQYYRRVLTEHPTSPWVAEALAALARLFVDQNLATKALEISEQLAQNFPTHAQAANALWEAGWLQYRSHHYEAAARIFRRFEQLLPHADMLPQTLYWHARALHQQGKHQAAEGLYRRLIDEYPFHYYRWQATLRLRQAGDSASFSALMPSTPHGWQPPTLVTLPVDGSLQLSRPQFHLLRMHELQQLQMHRQASREISQLSTLLPDTHDTTYFLSKLFTDNQDHLAAFSRLNALLDTLRPEEVRQLPRAVWTMLYPRPFWDEIEQHARTTALDPYLVISIMRQESAFATAAVSSAGARGLMQLMPATAQLVSQRLHLGKITHVMLEHPQLNIRLGTHYFASMLKRYEGNVVLALAAYNAGPGRADRWSQEWPQTPQDEFIEQIPFNETRLYVKLVLRNLMNYERLYKALPDS